MNDACFDVDSPARLPCSPGNLVGLTAGVLSTPTPSLHDHQWPANLPIVTPFKGQTQVKGFVTYRCRRFVVRPCSSHLGPTITANYAASTAEIFPSLGRNLAACGVQVTAPKGHGPIVVPQQSSTTVESARLRFAKRWRSHTNALQANINIYKVFKAAPFRPQYQLRQCGSNPRDAGRVACSVFAAC